ncbi:MAG: thiamine-phosphate kinase [Thermodesulfobacteriota bacterium]|nr:thiamine-phosphate kinase [Thermodesulfobacteriota bacterium]
MKFNEIGEFGFIESIKKQCSTLSKNVIKGIGDDCAVFRANSSSVFLFTTDMLVEDVHFIMDKITPYQLGWKSVAVNLSDIAAMGGIPLHVLISIGIPVKTDVELIKDLYRGMNDICSHYNVNILGGDTVASRDKLIINISLLGDGEEHSVLYRHGAGPGDKIYLTGYIGDSSAGLNILKNEILATGDSRKHFIKAHNEPWPLIETGRIIATSQLASAMIDLSDGLLSDLGHICKESKVGASIFEEQIPLSKELKLLSSRENFNPLKLALSGGEDYILLFTAPEKNIHAIEQLSKEKNISPLFIVGEITKEKGIMLIDKYGKSTTVSSKGFDHFSNL